MYLYGIDGLTRRISAGRFFSRGTQSDRERTTQATLNDGIDTGHCLHICLYADNAHSGLYMLIVSMRKIFY